jgi:hypothetical protein
MPGVIMQQKGPGFLGSLLGGIGMLVGGPAGAALGAAGSLANGNAGGAIASAGRAAGVGSAQPQQGLIQQLMQNAAPAQGPMSPEDQLYNKWNRR